MEPIRDLIIQILGEYSPSLSPSGEVLGGLFSLDLTWIVGAAAFLLMLYFCGKGLLVVLKGLFHGGW